MLPVRGARSELDWWIGSSRSSSVARARNQHCIHAAEGRVKRTIIGVDQVIFYAWRIVVLVRIGALVSSSATRRHHRCHCTSAVFPEDGMAGLCSRSKLKLLGVHVVEPDTQPAARSRLDAFQPYPLIASIPGRGQHLACETALMLLLFNHISRHHISS